MEGVEMNLLIMAETKKIKRRIMEESLVVKPASNGNALSSQRMD
jgi:hypothetical protein